MTEAEALQFAMYALGACVVGIGTWIASSITAMGNKLERSLVVMESHEVRISSIENEIDYNPRRRPRNSISET